MDVLDLEEKEDFTALPYILKKMANDNKNFAKTEPHPKYKCTYGSRCAWHSKKVTK